MKQIKEKGFKSLSSLLISVYLGSKVLNEIVWENREDILKGKSIFSKIIFYISHFLG